MKPRIYKWHGQWYCDTHRCATTFHIGHHTPAAVYEAWDAVRKLLSNARSHGHDQQVMDDLNKQAAQLLIGMDFTDELWRDQLFQEWQPSEKDIKLSELAAEYHERCEAYDRAVCTGAEGPDGIMPASYKEHGLILKNASHVYASVLRKATEHGISKQELRLALGKDR